MTVRVGDIYAIVNESKQKAYIGSTRGVLYRFDSHRYTLNRGSHPNAPLLADWQAFGCDAFEFQEIEEVVEPAILTSREYHWMEVFRERGYTLYNIQGPPIRRDPPVRPVADPSVSMSELARQMASFRKTREKTCPVCGTVFEAFAKQKYDTRQCANRASYAKHAERRRDDKREYRRRAQRQPTEEA